MIWKPRGLRYQLRPQDVLCFHHIPSTAGRALCHLLQDSLELTKGPDALTPVTYSRRRFFSACGETQLTEDDFLRARVILYLLRDPVDRVVSLYHAARWFAEHFLHQIAGRHDTLDRFLADPEAKPFLSNAQAFAVAGVRQNETSEQVVLDVAKINLDEAAFFGLTDRLADSLRLLCETFFLEAPSELDFLRTGRITERQPALAAAQRDDPQSLLDYSRSFLAPHLFESLNEDPARHRELLVATLSGKCNEGFQFLKLNPLRPKLEDLTQATVEHIRSLNQIDIELLAFAESYFEQRALWISIEADLANQDRIPRVPSPRPKPTGNRDRSLRHERNCS